MTTRISSLSTEKENGINYQVGDLSLFPEILDDTKSLYIVSNNAETFLSQSIPYNGKYVIVKDASNFPAYGIIKVCNKNNLDNFELIYYDKRNNNTFMNLVRGFAGTRQSAWQANNVTISNPVNAETHNALKDAVLNIQKKLGVKNIPETDSLNQILKSLESKHLAPKPIFRCYPLKGPAGTKIRFQNFSNNQAIRFLWDFGDGSVSSERNPTYTYESEGIYTIKLNMITSTGAHGISIKSNYITISNSEIQPFFYSKLISSTSESPATFEFVDQTDGDILTRYWVFDDGTSEQIVNPNIHNIQHTYVKSGKYTPSLLIVFKDQSKQRVFLQKSIEVI
jgi:PKD repeat protein